MATLAPSAPLARGDLKTLLPEALTALYEANPFRVLGLPPTASVAAAQKIADELLVRHSLGDGDIDEYRVREAVQCLRDPRKRLAAELFWFTLDGTDPAQSVDAAAYQKLMAGDRNAAAQLWLTAAKQGPAATQGRVARNLAILYHWHVLTAEASDNPLYRRFPPDKQFQPEYLQVWQAALQAWAHVWAEPRAWDALRQRVVEIDDPRLSLDTVEALRQALPETLLQINRELAVQYLRSGHTYLAKHHLDLIRQAGFDESLASALCRDTLTPLKERINAACDAAAPRIWNSAARAQQVYAELMDELRPDLEKLRILDPQQQFSTATVWDKIADTIHAAALEVHNHASSYQQALDMLNKALEFAISPSSRSRLQEDRKVFQESLNTWGEHYSPDLCWFCKKRKATGELEHHMHKVTGRRGNTVYFDKLTLKIPRCATCTWWHTVAHRCGVAAGVAGAIIGAGVGRAGWDAVWIAVFLGGIGYGLGRVLGMTLGFLRGSRSKGSKHSYPRCRQAEKEGYDYGAIPVTR